MHKHQTSPCLAPCFVDKQKILQKRYSGTKNAPLKNKQILGGGFNQSEKYARVTLDFVMDWGESSKNG